MVQSLVRTHQCKWIHDPSDGLVLSYLDSVHDLQVDFLQLQKLLRVPGGFYKSF